MAPPTIVSSPETWFVNETDGWPRRLLYRHRRPGLLTKQMDGPVDYCIVTSRWKAPSTIVSSPETWFVNEADGWPHRLLYRHRRPGLLMKQMDGPVDCCIVTGDLVC